MTTNSITQPTPTRQPPTLKQCVLCGRCSTATIRSAGYMGTDPDAPICPPGVVCVDRRYDTDELDPHLSRETAGWPRAEMAAVYAETEARR